MRTYILQIWKIKSLVDLVFGYEVSRNTLHYNKLCLRYKLYSKTLINRSNIKIESVALNEVWRQTPFFSIDYC